LKAAGDHWAMGEQQRWAKATKGEGDEGRREANSVVLYDKGGEQSPRQ
jgi:hypothetical protein